MTLILASSSPRRLELLQKVAIVPDQILPADINEDVLKGESATAYVERLAQEKAGAIHAQHKKSIVLAADTVVVKGTRIIGKPADAQDAVKILKLLSGGRHRVLTGMCVVGPNGKSRTRLSTTTVQFKRLTFQEIDLYIASKEWEGKAGGYGIQGRAAAFVKSINGSYSNVVGLDVHQAVNLLRGAGYHG